MLYAWITMLVVARLPLKGHCVGRPIKWYRHAVLYLPESDKSSLYEVVDDILSTEQWHKV
jgi:hypothetical protein